MGLKEWASCCERMVREEIERKEHKGRGKYSRDEINRGSIEAWRMKKKKVGVKGTARRNEIRRAIEEKEEGPH